MLKNIFFAIVFLIAGIGMSLYGITLVKDARESSSWPTVQGTVMSSKVVSERHTTGTGSKRRTSTVHGADVRYKYIVGSHQYSSNRISFGDYKSGSKKRAQKIADRYSRGTTVTVHYDPNSPGDAVIETGTSWSSFILLGSGFIFFIVGIIFVRLIIKGRITA